MRFEHADPRTYLQAMRRNTRVGALAAAAAVTLTALAIGACGGGGSATITLPKTAGGKAATVGLANEGNLGKILVDSQGRSLYLFQKDMGTTSECSGACAAAWPPLRATGKPVVGTALSASKIGTTARSDGKPQVTYNGHPLYLYSADQKPGDTNGQGLNVFGGGWFAVSAAGNIVSGKGSGSGSGY
jgi:predicted lipoprotein with Yx(FWY)xxD motif